jgi:hypothetical protein
VGRGGDSKNDLDFASDETIAAGMPESTAWQPAAPHKRISKTNAVMLRFAFN